MHLGIVLVKRGSTGDLSIAASQITAYAQRRDTVVSSFLFFLTKMQQLAC